MQPDTNSNYSHSLRVHDRENLPSTCTGVLATLNSMTKGYAAFKSPVLKKHPDTYDSLQENPQIINGEGTRRPWGARPRRGGRKRLRRPQAGRPEGALRPQVPRFRRRERGPSITPGPLSGLPGLGMDGFSILSLPKPCSVSKTPWNRTPGGGSPSDLGAPSSTPPVPHWGRLVNARIQLFIENVGHASSCNTEHGASY